MTSIRLGDLLAAISWALFFGVMARAYVQQRRAERGYLESIRRHHRVLRALRQPTTTNPSKPENRRV